MAQYVKSGHIISQGLAPRALTERLLGYFILLRNLEYSSTYNTAKPDLLPILRALSTDRPVNDVLVQEPVVGTHNPWNCSAGSGSQRVTTVK